MKCSISKVHLALAVFALLWLAGPTRAQQRVPFRGTLQGVDAGTPIPNSTLVSVKVQATGNATHLGRFTFTLLATVNTKTMIGTGTFLFTAANGDTVFGTSSGKATLTAPGVLTIVENMIITGGTGRFAGSTGSFTAVRLKNLANSATTGSFAGTISSPGLGN
jgi:hypothetical protein